MSDIQDYEEQCDLIDSVAILKRENKAITAERDELKHQVGLLKMERDVDQEEVTGHREAERLLALELTALKKELEVKDRALRLMGNVIHSTKCNILFKEECSKLTHISDGEVKAFCSKCRVDHFTAKAREEG